MSLKLTSHHVMALLGIQGAVEPLGGGGTTQLRLSLYEPFQAEQTKGDDRGSAPPSYPHARGPLPRRTA